MLLSLPDMELFGTGVIFDYAGWRRWSAYGSEGAGASRYLERNQQRESNGRMGRAEYVIYEMPRKKPCSESPCTRKSRMR